MNKYFVIITLTVILSCCDSARILVILPTVFKSHLIVFNSIVDILATEHKITFYSAVSPNRNHENVTEKRIANEYVQTSNFRENFFTELTQRDSFEQIIHFLHYHKDTFKSIFSGNDISELFSCTEKYDLLLVGNMLSEALFKLSFILNVSLIQVAPSIPMPPTNDAINIRNNFGYDLSFLTYENPNSLFERMKKFIKHTYVYLYYEWIYIPALEKISKKYFPADTPTIKQMARKTEGILANYISAMGYIRAVTPKVLEIGGLHCKASKSLPTELEEFVSGSGEHGVIYFSLGATFTDAALSPEIKASILNVLKKLPQRILLKLDDDIEDLPANIKVSKWFPQQDILGHNKTKLFIMQGGMLSIQEAAYHGVPVLVLPLINDQFTNGYIAEKKGYGKVVSFKTFNENEFYHSIKELATNASFKENAELISASIKDQPISTEKKLKHWINFIIRHRKISPFKSDIENLSVIELMEFDIFFIILIITILLLLSIMYIYLYLLNLFKMCYRIKLSKKRKLT